MHSRWFNVAVILLWVATMSWLVTKKVLPSMLIGEPPNYTRILAAQRAEPLIAWKLLWNERCIGWAVHQTGPLGQELTEVRSRVHFDELPLQEILPMWLRPMLQPLEQLPGRLKMESRNKLVFDPLGLLSRFDSAIGFDPDEDLIKIHGVVDGEKLTVSLRCGDLSTSDMDLTLPGNTMVFDALSPQSRLPGLRDRQSWTLEVYSPLNPPNNPMEILRAEVEGKAPIQWNGETVEAWVVVYRADPGDALSTSGKPRSKLWVHRDGTVLKQEIRVFDAAMTFVRLTEEQRSALPPHATCDDRYFERPLAPGVRPPKHSP